MVATKAPPGATPAAAPAAALPPLVPTMGGPGHEEDTQEDNNLVLGTTINPSSKFINNLQSDYSNGRDSASYPDGLDLYDSGGDGGSPMVAD